MKPIYCGLDISDFSIELLALNRAGSRVSVDRCARIALPAGLVTRGMISDPVRLGRIIVKLFNAAYGSSHGPVQAGLSLPEAVVYSKTFELPVNMEEDAADQATILEAAKTFPLPAGGAVTTLADYGVVGGKREVFYAATDKPTYNGYVQACKTAGITPLFIETEASAQARSLVPADETRPLVIADIGARATLLTIVEDGLVRFSSSVAIGGDALTMALEKARQIPLSEAEETKRRIGFDPRDKGGWVYAALEPAVNDIIEEIRRTAVFHERRTGWKPEKVILTGGTSLMIGFKEAVAAVLSDADVDLGDPFSGIAVDHLPYAVELRQTSVLYATAAGLAMRAVGLARAGPKVDFIIGHQHRPSAVAKLLKKTFHSLANMVTKIRHPKSAAAGKGKKPLPEAPAGPAPAAEAAPVLETAPAAPARKRTALLDEESTGLTAAPAAPEPSEPEEPKRPAAPARPEETDFGQNVGELLGHVGPTFGKEPPPRKEEVMPGGGGMLIHEILERKKKGFDAPPPKPSASVPEVTEEDEESVELMAPVEETEARRGPSIILVALAVIFIAAAATGTYLFISRNGLSILPVVGGWFGGGKEEAVVPDEGSAVSEIPSSVSVNVRLVVAEETADSVPVIKTRVLEASVTAQGEYDATGEAAVAAAGGKASGVIKIVNTTSSGYTFVATTRFLSSKGVLFRLKRATAIPANGSVEAEVAADKTGAEGDIGPDKFTIPGLSADLQPLVWGESSAAMTGGASTTKAVTVSDLAAAKADLAEKLKPEADKALAEVAQVGEVVLPELATIEESAVEGPEAGTAGAKFTMKLTLKYLVLAVPEAEIETLLAKKLSDTLPEGEIAADYDLGTPSYLVEAYDAAAGRADLRAESAVTQ